MQTVSIFQVAVSLKALVKLMCNQFERNAILVALAKNHWSKKLTARNLKISVVALTYKMEQHGISRSNEVETEAEDES